MTVYIPTLDRVNNIRSIVPYWREQEIPVRLVVERHQYAAYNNMKNSMNWGSSVYVLPLPLSGRGIGYARRYCVTHAKNTALESIIMSDDDMRPIHDSDMWELLDEAAKPDVLGIGATRSLHDRNTGGAISANHGPILCPGGWGFQLFGLNIKNALSIGNFDASLHTMCEDAELARQGIVNNMPWLVHCDVKVAAIGKRYAPGGFSSKWRTTEARDMAEKECMAIVHKRWPDYTNSPDKLLRVAWQRMLDDYIPEWREASAIHGGSLDKLRKRE
jgi:hypothetical protein